MLGRQEKDFLAAYRAHMYNVQKELHEMREKIRRNETVENKSEKIKKLEDERDWYRKEALRLDAFTTSMSKDLKAMKDKLEAIEEDRDWLEKQLKACKKQNKLLRAELDLRNSSTGANSRFGTDNSSLPPFDAGITKPQRQISVSKASPSPHQQRSTDNALGEGTAAEDGLPHLNLDGLMQSPTIVEEREEKLKKKIRQLKRDLQQRSQELAIYKQQQRYYGREEGCERSHLESLFIQCVESVKEEVSRRRNTVAGAGTLEKLNKPSRQRTSMQEVKTRNQRVDAGPEFDDFTPADRVRLIERLLAHNEVLALLYGQLFPSDVVNSAGDGTSSGNGASDLRPSSPTLHSFESLPNAVSGVSIEEASRVAEGTPRAMTPVGSGAAVASAARGAGLPIDNFTKDYLKSM